MNETKTTHEMKNPKPGVKARRIPPAEEKKSKKEQ
jgi:hypothetical protein